MPEWVEDKRWSDRFLPEIKRILGEHLIAEPPIEEDAERNTDLVVLRLDAVRIACRVRKHKYLESYGDEFTIRAGRPSGQKTELTKIIEGWGDYFFYGFSDEQERFLAKWILGDLKAFRVHFNRMLYLGQKDWSEKNNHDNSSSFFGFKAQNIPKFLVAQNQKGRVLQHPASKVTNPNHEVDQRPNATAAGW